jgi:hypothetical protein
MLTMDLYNTLWFASMLAEVAVVGVLLSRRVWRSLPVFFVYCLWCFLSDAGSYILLSYFPKSNHTLYLVQTILDYTLQFSVLVELAWSVLRPVRTYLRRRSLIVVSVLILAIGAVIWPFTGIHPVESMNPVWQRLVPLMQTVTILRILFFLVLAGCSQLFSIGWRDRELQIATGFGFYSIVSVAVQILDSHQATLGPQYRFLHEVEVASNFCSLLYWVVCFAQKETQRREFTPQMQSFLLAVAGSARTTRSSLLDQADAKKKRERK